VIHIFKSAYKRHTLMSNICIIWVIWVYLLCTYINKIIILIILR